MPICQTFYLCRLYLLWCGQNENHLNSKESQLVLHFKFGRIVQSDIIIFPIKEQGHWISLPCVSILLRFIGGLFYWHKSGANIPKSAIKIANISYNFYLLSIVVICNGFSLSLTTISRIAICIRPAYFLHISFRGLDSCKEKGLPHWNLFPVQIKWYMKKS